MAFEAFRDIVKLLRKGLKDAAGLAYVENEALDIRVKARSKASVDAGVKLGSAGASGMVTSHIPTVVAAAAAAAASEAAAAADRGGEDGDEGGDAAEDDMIDAAEDDAAALDRVGAECGIASFTAQLQRAVIQEEEDEQENNHLRKKYWPSPATAFTTPSPAPLLWWPVAAVTLYTRVPCMQEAWPQSAEDGDAGQAHAWRRIESIRKVTCMVQGDAAACSEVQVHTPRPCPTRNWHLSCLFLELENTNRAAHTASPN